MHSFLKSFRYACSGIVYAAREGRNFKVQLALALLACVLGCVLQISATQWAIIALCIALVLGGECANTAIEALVDLVSPEHQRLAGIAKDCAAGAVLVFSLGSLAVACFIFIPKIAALLGA